MFSFFGSVFTKITSLVASAFIAVGLIPTPAHPIIEQPAAVIQTQNEPTSTPELSEIERLRKENAELKKVKPTIQKPEKLVNPQSNHENPKPQTFKLPNGAIVDEQGNILNKVEMDRANVAEEQNRIINDIIKQKEEARIAQEQENIKRRAELQRLQEEARIAQEQESLRRQAELQRLQEEQNKTNQINSLLAEYQQKVSDIDAQILTIKQQYYRDVENEKQRAVSQPFLDGMINKLTNAANWKIDQLQLEKESLRLQYLSKVNSIR